MIKRYWTFDGSMQCLDVKGTTPEELQGKLEALGITIHSAYKGRYPEPLAAQCGLPTADINVIEIDEADASRLPRDKERHLAFFPWSFSGISVYAPVGDKQCYGGGESLADAQNRLEGVGIAVLSARREHDGLQRIALCGGETGNLNVMEIAAANLLRALDAGFWLLIDHITVRRLGDLPSPLGNRSFGGDLPFPLGFGVFGGDLPFPLGIPTAGTVGLPLAYRNTGLGSAWLPPKVLVDDPSPLEDRFIPWPWAAVSEGSIAGLNENATSEPSLRLGDVSGFMLRVIRLGQGRTKDFNMMRLNLVVDNDARIVSWDVG